MPPLVNTDQGKATHMRLRTIWTLPGLPLAERLDRTADTLCLRLAQRFPKRLAYWAFVAIGGRAMRPDDIVPEVGYSELFNRMSKR